MESSNSTIDRSVFRKYLDFEPKLDATQSTVNVYFAWETDYMDIEDFHTLANGDQQRMLVPIEHRIASMPAIRENLKIARAQSKNANHSPWNSVEYTVNASGEENVSTYWDQDAFNERNPDVSEAVLQEMEDNGSGHEEDADAAVVTRDYSSESSTRPWYFINTSNFQIKQLVYGMIMGGSELEEEDFDEINFDQPQWSEFETFLKNALNQDSKAKVCMHGTWNEEESRYTSADFYVSIQGKQEFKSVPINA